MPTPSDSSKTLLQAGACHPWAGQHLFSADHIPQINGKNYLQWSQSVMMFICGRGKDELLLEASTIPKPDDPKFKTWKSENNLVMSWLINSMTLEIGENFLLYHSVKEIWDATKNTYLSRDNSAELFAVESLLHDQRQGDESVTTYFTTLTRH